MRKVKFTHLALLFLFGALLWGGEAKASIDLSTITDATLKSCLDAYDTGTADDILDDDEIADVTTLTLDGSTSVAWDYIQYFTNATELHFTNSTTVDSVSTTGIAKLINLQKLVLDNNWTFNALDLSSNTALTYISCANSPIYNGMSGTISGYNLPIYTYNTGFTQIVLPSDVSQITYLDIHNNPAIFTSSTIDFSSMTSLVHLDIDMTGYRVDTLKVSGLTNLEYLACGWKAEEQYQIYDHLSWVYTGGYYKMDELLKGSYLNYIKTIDVSNLTNLKYLECNYNTLTAQTLNISALKNLEHLECANCNLTSLDFSAGFSNLVYLFCGNFWRLYKSYTNSTYNYTNAWNKIESLDLSYCPALQRVRTEWIFELTSLNVSGCTKLVSLNTHDCALTSLDLSTNTELDYLNCQNNCIPALDLSNNTLLCTGNETFLNSSCSVTNQDIGYQKLYIKDGNLYIDVPDAVTTTGEIDSLKITINDTTTTYTDFSSVISENDSSGHKVYLLPVSGNMQLFTYNSTDGVGTNNQVVYYYHTNGVNVSGDTDNEVASMDVHMWVLAYVEKFKHQYASICLPYPYEVADTAYRLGAVDTENYTVTLSKVGSNFGAASMDSKYDGKGLPLIVKMNDDDYVEGSDNNYVVYNRWTGSVTYRSFLGETLDLLGTDTITTFKNDSVYVLGTNKQPGSMYGKQGIWILRNSNADSTTVNVPAFRCYAPKPTDLNFAKGFTFVLEDESVVNGIDGLTDDTTQEESDGNWYTLEGIKLNSKPTAPGIYINNGKKVVVK